MEVLERFIVGVAVLAEAAGVVVVAVGVLRAVGRYTIELLRRRDTRFKVRVRLEFGRSLALALDFLVAADLVRTAVAPDWDTIGQLALIVLIRSVLNFFLQREMEQEKHELEVEL
jgi:uncharacterized membrane protein